MNCVLRSAVKERVVWVDTKRTQVKSKSGKLKEKEITILEVRVKAQIPGDKKTQEVLYSTESHTDRSFCRTGVDILPWKSHTQTGLGHTRHSPHYILSTAIQLDRCGQNCDSFM